MVAGIELVHRQTALKEDTGIGLLFVGMLTFGVAIISRSDSYTGSLTAILFGDALGVTRNDLIVQARGLTPGHGTRTAVAAAHFTIPAAAITPNIGANRSGKSARMHAIAGALPQTAAHWPAKRTRGGRSSGVAHR